MQLRLVSVAVIILTTTSLSLYGAETSVSTQDGNQKQKFHSSLVLTSFTNMYEVNTADHRAGSALDASLAYLFNANYSLAGMVGVTQFFTDDTLTSVKNSSLTLSKARAPLGGTFEISNYLIGVLPTNEDDREHNSYLGSMLFGTNLILPAKDNRRYEIGYTLELERNFHQYTHTALAEPNTEYGMRHIVDLTKTWDKLSFNISFNYANLRTYSGAIHHEYGITEQFKYNLSNTTVATLGIGHGGNALTYDGRDHNIKLYDGDSANVFLGVSISN